MGLVEPAEDGPADPPTSDPNPSDRALSVGLLLGSARPPRWQATMVRELGDAAFIDLFVYIAESPPPAQEPGPRGDIARRLFRLYECADRSIFGSSSDPLAESDLAAELQTQAALADAALDVLIVLGAASDRLPGAMADRRLWTLCFGDPARHPADGPPLFWELH